MKLKAVWEKCLCRRYILSHSVSFQWDEATIIINPKHSDKQDKISHVDPDQMPQDAAND